MTNALFQDDLIHRVQTLIDQQLSKFRQNLVNDSKVSSNMLSSQSNNRKLERDNQILLFQLKVHKKVLEILATDPQQIQIASKLVQAEAAVHNLEILKTKYDEMKAEKQKQRGFLQQLQARNAQLQQKCRIYKKKTQEYDRLGGKSKINKINIQLKQQEAQRKRFAEQSQRMKDKLTALKRNCQILTQLNRQTEDKLANFLVQNSDKNKQNTCLQNASLKSAENKTQLVTSAQERKNKVETLAEKEELRRLRRKVEDLESEKQRQRHTFDEKEKLYSKMILK